MKRARRLLAVSVLVALLLIGCSEERPQPEAGSDAPPAVSGQQEAGSGLQPATEQDSEPEPAVSRTAARSSTEVVEPADSRQEDNEQEQQREQVSDEGSPPAEALEPEPVEHRQDWEFEGAPLTLHRFESCDQLLAYHRGFSLNNPLLYELEQAVETGHPPPASDPHHISMQSSHRLSARLKGVEESDKVQTDGTHIYSVTSTSLVVSRVLPTGSTEPLAALELTRPTGYTEADSPLRHELLLHDQKLLVIRNWKNYYDDEELYDPGNTQLFEIDVGQPQQPIIVRRLLLAETLLLAAWRNGRHAQMAFWHAAPRIELHAAVDMRGVDDPAAAAREQNRAVLNHLSLESWHPRYALSDTQSGETNVGFAAACDSSFVPRQAPRRRGTTIVASVDPSHGLHSWQATALLGDHYQLHATGETVYLARSDLIDGADAQIYQFNLSGDRGLTYAGFYFHEGRLLWEQALDDHAGHLRVAFGQVLSDEAAWVGEIVVLERIANAGPGNLPRPMRRVGSIDGTEEGWEIRHIRFWDDVAYITPWLWDDQARRESPSYVIDLSQPEQPTVAGTLRLPELAQNLYLKRDPPIPAVRRHDLFRVGDGLAVVIGQPVGKTEAYPSEIVLSVFDLSDPLLPRLLQNSRTLWNFSMAEYDERAMLIENGRFWFSKDWIDCQGDQPTTWWGVGVRPSGFAELAIPASVAGCTDGPPGVRAVLVGGQLHLVSRYEIRSFDPETGDELGVQALSQ